jgi:hypothetical protein
MLEDIKPQTGQKERRNRRQRLKSRASSAIDESARKSILDVLKAIMNEPSIPPAADFKDRRTGLIIFGVIEILIGCMCALFAPFMVLAQVMSAQATGMPVNYRMAMPGVFMYGILAVVFIWLGIGSIRCRRWARALTLILAWTWLCVGVVAICFLAFFLPRMMTNLPDEAVRLVAMAITGAVMFFIFILVPSCFIIFYQGKNVKATVEARDPSPNWTDACPMPVLTLSLGFGFGVVTMLPMLFLGQKIVLPFFGILLTGVPGILFYLAFMAVLAYLTWGLYRLQPMAWWITAGLIVVMAISTILTFLRVDLMEMYRLMGYPEEQIRELRELNFSGSLMVWWSAIFAAVFVGYMLWVKRYFRIQLNGSKASQ